MEHTHHVTVTLRTNYDVAARFDDVAGTPSIRFDEPHRLGDGHAPNAAAVLGAAVGDCLAASLAFCLRKMRLEPVGLTAKVATHVSRNPSGRFRISGIDVELTPALDQGADAARVERCEHLFEDFCTVTASIRQGIPINVTVVQPAAVRRA
jgi:uncharacterized OsmC-like protein